MDKIFNYIKLKWKFLVVLTFLLALNLIVYFEIIFK